MKTTIQKLLTFANRVQPFSLLLLRALLGLVFLRTGWGKLHHLDQVTEFFTGLGIPAARVQAPFVAGVEFFGGAALILGFLVRPFSALLTGVMIVALATAVVPGLEDKSDIIGTPEIMYLFTAIYLITRGGGPLSLDRFISKKLLQD